MNFFIKIIKLLQDMCKNEKQIFYCKKEELDLTFTRQKRLNDCVIACFAMYNHLSYEESYRLLLNVFYPKKGICYEDLEYKLQQQGLSFEKTEHKRPVNKQILNNGFYGINITDYNNKTYSHCVIVFNGVIYDPDSNSYTNPKKHTGYKTKQNFQVVYELIDKNKNIADFSQKTLL